MNSTERKRNSLNKTKTSATLNRKDFIFEDIYSQKTKKKLFKYFKEVFTKSN